MGLFIEAIDARPEAVLNVLCVRCVPPTMSAADTDWEKVLDFAQIHGVFQFLASAASRGEIQPPQPWSGILTTQQERNTVRSMLQHRECGRIIDALAREGIPAVSFKGTSLSKLLYGRVADRISSDIDLLIPISELRRARDVLTGLEYAPADSVSRMETETLLARGNEMSLANAAGIVVELHWRLFEVDRACGLPIELEGLSRTGNQIANEDLFLVLALHALTHHWEALKWVVDIDAFVRNVAVDWSVVFGRAAASGTMRATGIALLLAHHVFETPLPQPIADRTARKLARRYAECLLTGAAIPPLADFWMQIAARERWSDRFRFVRFVAHLKPWDESGGRFKTLSRFIRLVTHSFRRTRLADMQKIPELHRNREN